MPLISIDTEKAALRMVSRYHISPERVARFDFEGFTDALVSSLEDIYDLEYLVTKELIALKEK